MSEFGILEKHRRIGLKGLGLVGKAWLWASLGGLALLGCAPQDTDVADQVSLLPVLQAGDFLADGELDLAEQADLRQERSRQWAPSRLWALRQGWAQPEPWGTFALGAESLLDLHLLDQGERRLILECGPPEVAGAGPQGVEVRVNGELVGRVEVPAEPATPGAPGATDDGWYRYSLPVAGDVLRVGANRAQLRFDHSFNLRPHDSRLLSLAVKRIALEPAASESGGQEVANEPRRPPSFKVDTTRDALFLARGGAYVVPYDVPDPGAVWSFDVRGVDWPDPVERFRAYALTQDGARHTLAEPAADGPVELDLRPFAGQRLTLVIESRVPTGGRLELRSPRMWPGETQAGPGSSDEPSKGASYGSTSLADPPRPHVLMIVLDALRRDHMGAYGYSRDTTPRLDRVAAEGKVFRKVVAECPYTLCSSPSFTAGLSFIDHGVVESGQRLGADVETLAGRLADLGYRTVGYTGNPNNAKITGGDLGFQEHYETWRFFPRKSEERHRWHPETLTNIVIRRLEAGFDGKPSMVMVHYVPPHEPYAPDPEFDVFGDPSYRGPVTPDEHQTRRIFRGEMTLSDADRRELVSLYDGNLLQADHHVGRLFDAYERLGMWRDTLVIITSDHGEAFGEHHATYGHNENLYGPMINVPLILRLPAADQAASADLEGVHSLTSIPPTVLSWLGETPGPRMTGRDLLAPAAPLKREIPQRTAHAVDPFYALHGERFVAMVGARLLARLYDHRQDPRQSRDLSTERPYDWLGATLRLEEMLARQHQAADQEVPEEERKMLESLGYAG